MSHRRSSANTFATTHSTKAGYYHKIIEGLESKGYKRGIDIFGATYDFRKAPCELPWPLVPSCLTSTTFLSLDESDAFNDNITRLIEEASQRNANRPVIVICHSNGCTYNYHYFLSKSREWKDRYIESWVTLGAPLGGAVEAFQAVVSGNTFHLALYSKQLFHGLERSFSSIGSILPVASVFGNETIMRWKGKNYTAHDMADVFHELHDDDGRRMWEQSSLTATPSPGLRTIHCLRATGRPTLSVLDFKTDQSFPHKPSSVYGEGDGTVNKASSDVCLQWQSDTPHFNTIEFDSSVNHMTLATSDQTLKYILDHVIGA